MTGASLPPPSAAERARTVLGRASSAAVRRPGAAREDSGRSCERIVVEAPRVRVWPLRLDRHGLVLRVERVTAHRDVRLPFTAPVGTAEEAR